MKRKLKNKRGASILIAMVVFLAASMVSVVIISASLTSVKRVKDDRQDKEEYLAVNSAARYFSKQIKNTECIRTLVSTDDEGNPNYSYDPADPPEGESVDGFSLLLKDMLEKAEDGDSASTNKRTLTLYLGDVPQCEIELAMEPASDPNEVIEENSRNKSYSITGTIKPKDVTDEMNYRRVYFTVWLTYKGTMDEVTTYRWGGIKMSTNMDDLG